MLSVAKRLQVLTPWLQSSGHHYRFFRNDAGPPRRRSRPKSPPLSLKKAGEKSEWWAVDGEMHEIGDNVPPRERFVIPRDNIPNRRHKQLRDQFMRRTRLVIKEAEHEPWCKRYMELYNELRENWERLYWDEGYSNKLAHDHANYESAEDDDEDFNPYRNKRYNADQTKDQGFQRDKQNDTWDKVNQVRDKFEFDRDRRMRDKAFAPMNARRTFEFNDSHSQSPPFDTRRYFED